MKFFLPSPESLWGWRSERCLGRSSNVWRRSKLPILSSSSTRWEDKGRKADFLVFETKIFFLSGGQDRSRTSRGSLQRATGALGAMEPNEKISVTKDFNLWRVLVKVACLNGGVHFGVFVVFGWQDLEVILLFGRGVLLWGMATYPPSRIQKTLKWRVWEGGVGEDPSQNSAFMDHYLDLPVDCHLEMTRSIVGWPMSGWLKHPGNLSVCDLPRNHRHIEAKQSILLLVWQYQQRSFLLFARVSEQSLDCLLPFWR